MMAVVKAAEPSPVDTGKSSVDECAADIEDGFTREQFERAFQIASPGIVDRANKAKAKGTIGKGSTRKLMEAALNAEPRFGTRFACYVNRLTRVAVGSSSGSLSAAKACRWN
jgi:hypothetical protein